VTLRQAVMEVTSAASSRSEAWPHCEPASQVRAGRHDGVAAERRNRQHTSPAFGRGPDGLFG
jgi:hypothetical protein